MKITVKAVLFVHPERGKHEIYCPATRCLWSDSETEEEAIRHATGWANDVIQQEYFLKKYGWKNENGKLIPPEYTDDELLAEAMNAYKHTCAMIPNPKIVIIETDHP